jgi:hypothetical protein
MQNLCVPPWVVRGALDDYQTVINTHQTRIVQKKLSCVVQMVFELLVDYVTVRFQLPRLR